MTQQLLREGIECTLLFRGERYPATILGVSENTIWVTFPTVEENIEDLGVDLTIEGNQGPIVYHTQVVVGPRAAGDGVILRRTPSSQRTQRRRAWRVPSSIRTCLRVRKGEPEFVGMIINLSLGGALLKIRTPYALGDHVDMVLALPGFRPQVVRTQVIHFHTPDGETDTTPPSFTGVRFVELDATAEHALTWHLWRAIRQLYPHELKALYPRGKERNNPPPEETTDT